MKSFSIVLTLLITGVGCQRSAPQWDTLSPFGAMRVPPPPTGGYGQPNNYYQYQSPTPPPGTPSFEVGAKASTSLSQNETADNGANVQVATNTPTGTASSNSDGFRAIPSATNAVSVAAHVEAASTVAPTSGDVRQTSATITPARAGGMAVTDLTRSAEPAPFRPPPDLIEITKLPAAIPTLSTVGPAPTTTRTPAQFPEHQQPVGTGLGADLKWRAP